MSQSQTSLAAAAAPHAAAIVLPAIPLIRTTATINLLELPLLRQPVARPDRNPSTGRGSNLEAWLGQATGQVQATKCEHCAAGCGPWPECVVVPGFLHGSCANCHYNSGGTRCSFRAGATARPSPSPPSPPAPVPSLLSRRRRRLPAASVSPPHRPLRQVTTGARIVDRVAPRKPQVRSHPCRRTPAVRALQKSIYYRELAAIYREEAEELEEEEEDRIM